MRRSRLESNDEILQRANLAYDGVPLRIIFKVNDPMPLARTDDPSKVYKDAGKERSLIGTRISFSIGKEVIRSPGLTLQLIQRVTDVANCLKTHGRLPELVLEIDGRKVSVST
jgi:hypothetical protein